MPRLLKSTADDVLLGHAVEVRFLELCALHRRVKGVDIVPPSELDADMLRWREMRVRHRCRKCGKMSPRLGNEQALKDNGRVRCAACGSRGDYRHTEAEIRSTKEIARWTVNAKAVLCGQPPVNVPFE